MSVVHCDSGVAGVLFDRGTGRAIRFARWFDAETGEYEAIRVASNGVDMACDDDYKVLRYRGKAVGRLELVPLSRGALLGVEPEKKVEPMRLTVQEKEQGVEDYRKLYYGVWGRREEAKRSIDERWVRFVQGSSFLDGLILKKGRMVPTT